MCIVYNKNTNIIHQITMIEGDKLSKSADDIQKRRFSRDINLNQSDVYFMLLLFS